MSYRFLFFIVCMLLFSSCSLHKKKSVKNLLHNASSLENRKVQVYGELVKKTEGLVLCSSKMDGDQCVNLEYMSSMKETLNNLIGSSILIYGVYKSHEYTSDDNLSFIPSRLHILEIKK